MSAQYRPYRDEESVDGLEAAAWTDHGEPGSIHIYEKTTEDLPFSPANRKALLVQIVLFVTVCFGIGFLLGYYSVSSSSAASHLPSSPYISPVIGDQAGANSDGPADAQHSWHHELPPYSGEDSTIKGKLLDAIDGNNILSLLNEFKDTNRQPGSTSDFRLAEHINKAFSEHLDRVSVTNFTFNTFIPSKPTVIKLLNKDNKTILSNLGLEEYVHDDMRPFLPLSQANETVITTNQLVYVNRGSKEDYAKLVDELGFSELKNKVLVMRLAYYQAHEAIKEAQSHEVSAILLFPDPDVYGQSSPFPNGFKLPLDAGRSHPTAWSNYGDIAAINLSSLSESVSKLALARDDTDQAPIVPISFKLAERLLFGLSGPPAPKEWNCFDYTLHLGPGYKDDNNEERRDKIQIEFANKDTSVTTTTVTGIITGSLEPDRYVVIGSRRDSLNRGLLDSLSGTAVMLEIARAYGSLVKRGWRPRRTIVFNSFGAESLNLIGSSRWIETHQSLMHSRAVAYLNCDLVVTGNQSLSVAASPLLYQTLYNATKQVENPNRAASPHLATVYDAWLEAHNFSRDTTDQALVGQDLERTLNHLDPSPAVAGEAKLPKEAANSESAAESLGSPGAILHEFRKSATTRTRPRIRHPDLRSVYSPFFWHAGIPVAGVRFAGFHSQTRAQLSNNNNNTHLIEDTLPALGTKYDNMDLVKRLDPTLKYHVTVARVLSEMLRDLSDSALLPFNLIDYSVKLKDSFRHFVGQHGKLISQANLDVDSLQQVIHEFIRASIEFHHRQDQVNLRDSMKVRKMNDQLMLLERSFLDSASLSNYMDRSHLILAPHNGQDHRDNFPGLVDWITLLDGDSLTPLDDSLFAHILKLNYNNVVNAIANAIKAIDEVYQL